MSRFCNLSAGLTAALCTGAWVNSIQRNHPQDHDRRAEVWHWRRSGQIPSLFASGQLCPRCRSSLYRHGIVYMPCLSISGAAHIPIGTKLASRMENCAGLRVQAVGPAVVTVLASVPSSCLHAFKILLLFFSSKPTLRHQVSTVRLQSVASAKPDVTDVGTGMGSATMAPGGHGTKGQQAFTGEPRALA